MKRIYLFLAAACGLFMMNSCAMEEIFADKEIMEDSRIFVAEFDGASSKTILTENTRTLWEDGDRIMIYDGVVLGDRDGIEYSTSLAEAAPSAEFAKVNPDAVQIGTRFLALYPAGADMSGTAAANLEYRIISKVNLPSSQKAVAGSYDPACALAVAYSEDENLLFRNVNALLKFKVGNEGVRTVRITALNAESLTGVKALQYKDEGPVAINAGSAGESDSRVEITAGEGTFEAGKEYYASVYPQTLQGGFSVEFIGAGGSVTVKSYAKSLELKRNVILNLGTIEGIEQDPSEEDVLADFKVNVLEDRVASAYYEFELEMPKECKAFFYKVYTEEEMLALQNSTSVRREKEALDLVNGIGTRVENPNFAWNANAPDGEKAIGESAKVIETDDGCRTTSYGALTPGSTIYVGYTYLNGYDDVGGSLEFSGPVYLDERNLTSPDNCKVKDLKLEFNNVAAATLPMTISYDPSTVSMIYLSYMTADYKPEGLTTESSWSEWVNYIFDSTNYDIAAWPTVESGVDRYTWAGMIPGTEYTFFICAEDFDGNVSPVQFVTVRTNVRQPGPDPTVNMSYADGILTFSMDHDASGFRYCYIDNASDLGIRGASLDDIANSGIPYQTWYDAIYEFVADLGLNTFDNTYMNIPESGTYIAACLAEGCNADGTPVYKMYNLIIKDGVAQTLEEIFGIE